MSFSDRDKLNVMEVLESIDKIFKFTNSFSKREFVADEKTQAAVAMMLQRVGEAGNRLSDFAKNKTKIDWREFYALRNRISHNYPGLDHELIWDIIEQDLPDLRARMTKLLAEIIKLLSK